MAKQYSSFAGTVYCVDWYLSTGHCVHGGAWLLDCDVGHQCLDGHVDQDGQQGGEDGAQHIVLATVLADLHHLGDHEADGIHPCHGSGEGEASHDGVEGLGLELESNGTKNTCHLL